MRQIIVGIMNIAGNTFIIVGVIGFFAYVCLVVKDTHHQIERMREADARAKRLKLRRKCIEILNDDKREKKMYEEETK